MLPAAAAALVLLAASPEVLLRLADERIDESSGLVASSTTPGVLFTHNDSGDTAQVFAVDERGRTLAVHTLPDTPVRDVEDAALGPGPALYLADTGDNSERRDRVRILRLPEPQVDPGQRDVRVRVGSSERLTFTYEDGAHDAEALLVHPRTGQLLVVTKSVFRAEVYAAPIPLADGVLRRVASVPVRPTDTPGGPDIGRVASLLVTGGAVSPDGRRLAVRTYTDAYVFDVPGDDLVAAFDGEPTVLPLPETRQGEGLTFTRDGAALLTSSEGAGAPVHRVPLAAGAGPGPPTGSAPPSAAQAPTGASEAPATAATPGGEGRSPLVPVLAGTVVAVLLLVVAGLRGRRR